MNTRSYDNGVSYLRIEYAHPPFGRNVKWDRVEDEFRIAVRLSYPKLRFLSASGSSSDIREMFWKYS